MIKIRMVARKNILNVAGIFEAAGPKKPNS